MSPGVRSRKRHGSLADGEARHGGILAGVRDTSLPRRLCGLLLLRRIVAFFPLGPADLTYSNVWPPGAEVGGVALSRRADDGCVVVSPAATLVIIGADVGGAASGVISRTLPLTRWQMREDTRPTCSPAARTAVQVLQKMPTPSPPPEHV